MTRQQTLGALGVTTGAVVQMVGWDDDCDEHLVSAVTEAAGSPPVDDTFEDVVDMVMLWWREDDGDLIDGLLDAITLLAEGGAIWLLTPKSGRFGHLAPEEITDAAPTAGLRMTANISAGRDWTGTKLMARG